MADIKIYGKLVNKTDGILADSEQVAYGESTVKEYLDNLDLDSDKTNYEEITGKDIDQIFNPGVYTVKNAINAPEEETSGVLTVSKVNDNEIKQIWDGEALSAIRVGTPTVSKEIKESKLLVSFNETSVEYSSNETTLSAGQTYTLSGFYKGHIVIGSSSDAPTNPTTLIFDGLTIESDIETAILYAPSNSKLIIILKDGSRNYISSYPETAQTGVSDATILSNNNLFIIGTGYLSVRNNWLESHGIKASEITIQGYPRISIECNHDAIHASSSLEIENGYYEISKASKAALESKNSDGSKGHLHIYGGEFHLSNCLYGISAAVEGKVEGLETKIYFSSVSQPVRYTATTRILETVEISGATLTQETKSQWFGVPEVKEVTENADGTYTPKQIIEPVDGKYVLNSASGIFLVSGYFENSRLEVTATSTDIILANAYINNSNGNPTILYSPSKKKLAVKLLDETSSYIINSTSEKGSLDYDGIKSENNLTISGKGTIYVTSVLGDAADGSDFIIKGDGKRFFINSGEEGIKGSAISIGVDPDDLADTTTTPSNSDQSIYSYGNGKNVFNTDKAEGSSDDKFYFADIYGRNGKYTKGSIVVYAQQKGLVYCGSIKTTVSSENSSSGVVFAKSAPESFTGIYSYVDQENTFEEFPKEYNIFMKLDESWRILKDSKEFVNAEDVKKLLEDTSLQVYDNLELAEEAMNKNNFKYGTTVVVRRGKTENYNEDYSLYTVVKDTNNTKVLKLQEGSGGSGTNTGKVTMTVNTFSIDGVEQDISETSLFFEANIGSKLVFSYSFESQYYPDVKGTVYCKVGSTIANQEKVLPNPGNIYTWTYDTSSLSAGIYTISIYGAESTGLQSNRWTARIEVGGLNISSTFDENTVLTAGNDLSVPVAITAADASQTITAHVKIDDSEVLTSEVTINTSILKIPGEYINDGSHDFEIYLTNEKGKTSNSLKYSIIAAKIGLIYVLLDKDIYEAAAGARCDVAVRTIQVGQEKGKFTSSLVIKNSAGEVVPLNGKNENTYTFSYGKNILQIIGLEFDKDDSDVDDYSKYIATLTTKSEDETAAPVVKEFEIHISKNNYDIQPISDGLLCWFDAKGKSNNDADRETWTDKSGNNVGATFGNFNWSSNGWLQDDSGDTALTLNSGSYVELDISPFEDEVQEMTISIDYETEDILDSSAKVASCLYEYEGTDTTTYYLRDAWGDYVKDDNNTSQVALDTSFKDLTELEDRASAISFILSGITNATEKTEKEAELENMTDLEVLEEYKNKKFTYVNNIVRYFMFAGGYCWINGETYVADGTTPYSVTYSQSERSINYNRGSENTAYDGKTNFKKFTGVFDETVTKQHGFYIDTQYGVLSDSASKVSPEKKFHLNFSQSTRTRMDFVITRTSGSAPYYVASMVGYVNGIISSIQEITNNNIFQQLSPNGRKFKVYLGCKGTYDSTGKLSISDTGSAKIYSFRIYNRALTHSEILYNYASEISDYTTKKNLIDNNDILKAGTLAKLPEICLMGADINGRSTIRDFIMQLANTDGTQISDLKAMKEPAYISYTDPDNSDKTWTADDGTFVIPCRLQFQGTSSLVYPVKNYKFKLYKSMTIENGKATYTGKLKKDIGNGIAENTFCIKANYMDSSNVRNTGSANFISDYNELSGNTPPMDLDSRIRTTVYGYPILLYYKEFPTSEERHFLGVGCLNLDKSATGSFGLDKDVDDVEGIPFDFGKAMFMDDDFDEDILHKTLKSDGQYETISLYDKGDGVYKDYTTLRNKDNLLAAVVSEKGYIRSINNDTVSNTQCFELKANSGSSGAGGFGNYFITSVANDVEPRYPDDGDLEDEEYATFKDANPTSQMTFKEFKTPWFYHFQRLIKWVKNADKNEFIKNIDKHFNRNYLMDYYLTIMLLGGVDSLGKNLMVGTWGPENRLYLTSEASLEEDSLAFEHTLENGTKIFLTPTKNKTLGAYEEARDETGQPLFYDEECYSRYEKKFINGNNSFVVTTKPGECIWYPMFYDIDTIMGVDNSGQLLFDVDIELGDQLDDGTMVFNTADSHLWTKVKEYLGETDSSGVSLLSERWNYMRRSKFTYENLVEKFYYNDIISKIPEAYYNEDCFIKYIYEGPEAKLGSKNYLYCCHGSSYEHIKRWISQRIYYLDTLFGSIGATNASLRFSHSGYDSAFTDEDDYYANLAQLANKYPESYSYVLNATTGEYELINKNTGITIVPIDFNLKTYQPGYVGIKWFNGGKIHYKRVKRDEIVTIEGNTKAGEDTEVFIYGGSNIKEIGNMAPYNVKQFDFTNLNKLNKLQVGSDEYSSVIADFKIGNNTYLAELDLTKCTQLKDIRVEQCVNLKKVIMTDSGVTSISLPTSGGALETIAYGPAITSIDLQNFVNLSTILTSGSAGLNNITKFVIKNCPKILGSKASPNAIGWSLLQQTNNTSSLTTIEITSYGAVTPRETNGKEGYFFPNKYWSYATAKNIRGEIYYGGKIIPKNYTKFASSFPYLTITYNNVEDVSEMFANYNNLNCISIIEVYVGTDIYGKDTTRQVYYWTDSTPELQAKWHNTAMYEQYGVDTAFTSMGKYYLKNGVYYRLLGIYDDSDLDIIRAEIKEHLSNFKKFTNMTGLFKGMTILDYIDPDTFNSIDISTAKTDSMFEGCTNLKYFELPTDTVKNEQEILYYNYDKDNEEWVLVDKAEWDESTGKTEIKEGYYINPFTGEETTEKTSTYKKGMRSIGAGMFRNCNNVKVLVHKYDGEKVYIDNTAFEYPIFDVDSNPSNFTYDRPVILFENAAEELLETTSEMTTTIDGNTYENIPVEGKDNLYYTVNGFKERNFNYQNTYISLDSTTWLREVYFNVKDVVLNDSTTVPGTVLSYAETFDGKKIIFEANGSATSFNISSTNSYTNNLNILSACSGAFSGLSALKEIEIPLPKFDCLDTTRYLFNEEKSIANIFTRDKYTFEGMKTAMPATLETIFVVDSEIVPKFTFYGLATVRKIGFGLSVKTLESQSFYNCTGLETVVFKDKTTSPTGSKIETIGEEAFFGCSALTSFTLPRTVITLGNSAFRDNVKMTQFSFNNNTKFNKGEEGNVVPEGLLAGCTMLQYASQMPNTISEIQKDVFFNDTSLVLLNNAKKENLDGTTEYYNGLALSGLEETKNFDYFTNLVYIGDNAFANVRNIIDTNDSRNKLLKMPKTLRYIGENAFAMTGNVQQNAGYTEIVWDGNYDTEFSDLFIGSNAFNNIRTAWRISEEATPIENCIFVPKVRYIGTSVFKIPGTTPFEYALAKNTEESIGTKWVASTKKIIFSYYGLFNDKTSHFLYLLSSDNRNDSNYNGRAYIKEVTVELPGLTIPTSTTFDNKSFKVVEILSGAFDIIGNNLASIIFEENSQLELIESGVLKSTSLQAIFTGTTPDMIPTTLSIETGNILHNTPWFENLGSEEKYKGKFITLGKNIVGYIPNDDFNGILNFNDESIAECTTIFDSAFKSMTTLTNVILTNNIQYIYSEAFSGTSLTSIDLPNNIQRIASKAFLGCKFKQLVFPASLKYVDSTAFSQSEDKLTEAGVLEYVDIKDGTSIEDVNIFEVQQDITTNAGNSSLPPTANATLRTLHIPAGMSSMTTQNGFTQFRYLSQITNLYLGTLEVNNDPDDKNYGTYLCKNIPMYLDSSDIPTFTETEKAYVDFDGKQYYCPKFFRTMAQSTLGFKDAYILTTDEYSVNPLGDYSGNVELYFISRYPDAVSNAGVDFSKSKSLTREDILMIAAGFTSDSSMPISDIIIRREDWNKLTSTDKIIIVQCGKRLKFTNVTF